MEPKTAVITGGEGDLAKAVRGLLEADGWTVLAPGRADLDVTSPASVEHFFSLVTSLDLLINNAGVIADGPLVQMSEADFERVLDVCLKGAFLCSQKAMWLMAKKRNGHILNIGSFAALFGTAGQANYAAAKAGLIGLTKSTASEYGAKNVRCNCVLPGLLDTKMTRHLMSDAATKDELTKTHLLRKLNTVEDAARFIVFLDSMKGVSGQVFQLDSRVSRW
ncbi:MAG: SDR family oxidoreductase [Verrucomicrobiaceae bacterium]|nr:SDR family oxidoreductase [Verrucomicrobiaceae bacterium]